MHLNILKAHISKSRNYVIISLILSFVIVLICGSALGIWGALAYMALMLFTQLALTRLEAAENMVNMYLDEVDEPAEPAEFEEVHDCNTCHCGDAEFDDLDDPYDIEFIPLPNDVLQINKIVGENMDTYYVKMAPIETHTEEPTVTEPVAEEAQNS